MADKSLWLGLCLASAAVFAQQGPRSSIGRLESGATVSFVRASSGEWGIEIAGGDAPRITQPRPAMLEVFRAEDEIRQLTAGYRTIRQTRDGIDARADIAYGDNVVFHLDDQWSVKGAVL